MGMQVRKKNTKAREILGMLMVLEVDFSLSV